MKNIAIEANRIGGAAETDELKKFIVFHLTDEIKVVLLCVRLYAGRIHGFIPGASRYNRACGVGACTGASQATESERASSGKTGVSADKGEGISFSEQKRRTTE